MDENYLKYSGDYLLCQVNDFIEWILVKIILTEKKKTQESPKDILSNSAN